MKVFKIQNRNGAEFNVRIVEPGEPHGPTDNLTDTHRIVEFFAAQYEGEKFGPLGQFVNRYWAESLLDVRGGLALHLGIPEWTVDATAMAVVKDELIDDKEEI